MSRIQYTCHGPLSGGCGKRHGTLSGAADCLESYWARTGRTDRTVYTATGPNAPPVEARP
jgi:hypothetical protein